ncbi:MAG: hypothetical protein R3C10_26135 [Pirellulales bacterium]
MICLKRQQQPEILLVQQNPVEAGASLYEFSKWSEKHRVTSVPDVETAQSFLAQRGVYRRAPRPDMVLIDNDLPKNGAEALIASIHDSESLKGVPVFLMGDRVECPRHSSSDVRTIEKPLRLDALLRAARSCGLPWQDHQSYAKSIVSRRTTRVDQGEERIKTEFAFAGARSG